MMRDFPNDRARASGEEGYAYEIGAAIRCLEAARERSIYAPGQIDQAMRHLSLAMQYAVRLEAWQQCGY